MPEILRAIRGIIALIAHMNYIITSNSFTSELFHQLSNVKLISEEELENSSIRFSYEDKLYVPNETSLEFVLQKLDSDKRIKEIETLKDKYLARDFLKTLYPDFYFDSISLADLHNYKVPSSKKLIIKPRKGFFSTGIREIDEDTDLESIQKDMQEELKEMSTMFSDSVITTQELVIEERIPGDQEYAVDMFYDNQGKPVITNIQYHPLRSDGKYFFTHHYSSAQIVDEYYDRIKQILQSLNSELGATNLPVHAEFKEVNGEMIPIEFNVMRYGGFGFGDISTYTLDVPAYELYFESRSVDLKKRVRDSLGNNGRAGMVLCYNPDKTNTEDFSPDHEALKTYLGDSLVHYVEIDHTANPIFGIAIVSYQGEQTTKHILEIEFADFNKEIV